MESKQALQIRQGHACAVLLKSKNQMEILLASLLLFCQVKVWKIDGKTQS